MRVRHRKALCRDRFKACFWNSLRCSRYSPCRREKLSEMEFYLRYLCVHKAPVMRFLCVGICHIARRFEFCAAFGAWVAMRIAPHSSCAVGIDTVRALLVSWRSVLRYSVHSFTCRKVPPFEILREVQGASSGTIARHSASFVLCVCDLAQKQGLCACTCAALRLLPSVRHAASDARR